ncbi:AAA family ATPase [Burkholderiaceae bacterium FT117]|uniref:Lon protease family protein n=1 Tax=Zeimonas sediminis TaxID=2944268 RepID=UPI002342C180|nr:ATP-binding protein [Zeimonas sediminis]MCM5571910.1 AAA family ATPase [Zeimonas sediminis]
MTRVSAEALCHYCDPSQFDFETTDQLEPIADAFGQQRAIEAIELGVGIRRSGFNLFVLGDPATGKSDATRERIVAIAAAQARPDDWCYVNNFKEPHRPHALRFPFGRGPGFRTDIQQLIEELRSAIPAVLESDDYRSRVEQIDAQFGGKQEKAFSELVDEAQGHGILLLRTPTGFSFAPDKDGEVMPHEEFEKLPQEEKDRIAQAVRGLQEKLERLLRQVVLWRRAHRDEMRKLNREVTTFAVGNMVDDLLRRYVALPEVVAWLEAFKEDVVENADIFRSQGESMPQQLAAQAEELPPLRRYEVNLLVGGGDEAGAPVVTEENPTYTNLVGRIEHIARFGALLTDFGLIKAGALHRANGGYLLLDMRRVLMQPFAWEALKRALHTREVRIESPGQFFGAVSTVSLEPQPIPLDVKVVLFGDRMLHMLLQAYDPEFVELFKVAADFEDDADSSPESVAVYARVIGTIARKTCEIPLDRQAVARVIEFGAREVGDSGKLSLHRRALEDLLTESEYWARKAGLSVVGAEQVQRALDARIERSDSVRRRMQEEILRDTIMIDTQGAEPGQINGLAVYSVGELVFGQPTRITATTRIGDGHVIDIQRESQLAGAIHSKGVMILSAFVAARYAALQPFALSASLAFEQTYGPVEGDSASLAELCALVSSLAGVPIRQAWAVTGSVNQRGEVQAIGGVNEKIEGFFDICAARGLDASHGVMIPKANLRHLMLRHDVVDAVRDGRFAIHAVSHFDEAIALLTGEADIDRKVRARLGQYAEIARDFALRRIRGRRGGNAGQ